VYSDGESGPRAALGETKALNGHVLVRELDFPVGTHRRANRLACLVVDHECARCCSARDH
jgi:hypothetical protein